MSIFVPPFSNPLWAAMETMHFHIARTNLFRTPSFRIQGVPVNNLAPMKNCVFFFIFLFFFFFIIFFGGGGLQGNL